MKNNLFAKLSWLLDKRIFRKRHCGKATKCSSERATTSTPSSAASVSISDPNNMTNCDMCGRQKESVRPRKTMTIGRNSGTLRWKFCDECVAELGFQRMPRPAPEADFLIYFDAERENVLVKPQNQPAREYLESNPPSDPARWVGGALVIKELSVIRLAQSLIAAGFEVIGEKSLCQTPRRYVREGKRWLYTAGAIPGEAIGPILKNAGKTN
jgi:hypothetical protein